MTETDIGIDREREEERERKRERVNDSHTDRQTKTDIYRQQTEMQEDEVRETNTDEGDKV